MHTNKHSVQNIQESTYQKSIYLQKQLFLMKRNKEKIHPDPSIVNLPAA